MPKAIQLQVPEPCSENWQAMTPNEQGRHCMACRKTVVDFSVMSDKQMLEYISNASSSVCGRFSNDQLNKDIPLGGKKKRISFVYLWNLLIATFLVTGKTYAQGKPVMGKKQVVVVDPVPIMGIIAEQPLPATTEIPSSIGGFVFDSYSNEPVIGASIKVKGTSAGTMAGMDGNFTMKRPRRYKELQLEVSAIGYETQAVQLSNRTNWRNMNIHLIPVAEQLDSVVVTGYETMGRYAIAGGISVCYRETKTEMIKNAFADWIPALKKDIRVYPNPVVKGNTINMNVKLKEAGEYKMELMDASGRVVLVQPLRMITKEQSASIPTNTAWSTGVYQVRISGRHTKNIYQSRILIR